MSPTIGLFRAKRWRIPLGALFLSAIARAEAETIIFDRWKPSENMVTFESRAPAELLIARTRSIGGVLRMVDRVIAEASGEVVVDTGSFASGVALRDDAMRAPDWLNTQTYPFGRLIVNRLAADETVLGVSRAAEVVAHGTLEIRGIQQETTADVTLCYMPPHLLGDPDARLFINGKLVIDITRFGMNIPRQYIARINPQIVISVHLLARGSRASSSGETLLRVARPPSGATGPD